MPKISYYSDFAEQKRNKKRLNYLIAKPYMSERGDSNARPLRPERSALPTALLSVLRVQR